MSLLVDSHCHLDFAELAADVPGALADMAANGVSHALCVSVTLEDFPKVRALAEQHENLFASVGTHPDYPDHPVVAPQTLVELASHPKVVAIGETGLDRHWDFTPFEMQQDYFDRHMALAGRLDLPFIVHMRDCDAEIMEALRAEHRRRGPLRGIMHSFTGDAAMAAECMALGLHISFAGMVTYKKSQPLRDCAATIPADRVLIETDCPYLSPEPVRGKRPNEPAFVAHTATCLAIARSISPQEVARQTTANARALFRIAP